MNPPRSLHGLVESEFKEICALIKPNMRKEVLARNRLRSLAIMEDSLNGIRNQPSESDLKKLVQRIKKHTDWREIFPGIATLEIDSAGTGMTMSISITKSEGQSVRLVPADTPGATIISVKRVNELSFYSMGLNQLSAKLNLSAPKTGALIRYLGLQADEHYYKELIIGKSKYKRYSAKALDALKKSLSEVDMDKVWLKCKPGQRKKE